MIDNKLSLTFVLPGSTLLSSQECEENPKESYITHKILIPEIKGKGKNKKTVFKPLFIKTRKTRTVTQHINMNTDAYVYMLNTPTNDKLARKVKNKGKVVTAWNLLSEDKKLRAHLDLLAHDLGAISYSYEILQD